MPCFYWLCELNCASILNTFISHIGLNLLLMTLIYKAFESVREGETIRNIDLEIIDISDPKPLFDR